MLASVLKMYALSVVAKAKHMRGESREKNASYDRCQEAEEAQARLVLIDRGGMTYSNDMNNTETTCHKGIAPKRMESTSLS